MKGFLIGLLCAALVAVFFFHKAVKAGAFGDDRNCLTALRRLYQIVTE